ncbi:MAG: hypothetical protein HY001_00275 [Candidatus Portnoybacteria bacterium]|nr:hypothetical protein [Candidatus Portnoybacteria bacterium]
MNPKETLQDLGLTQKEAIVYLALLEIGEATVNTIAIKSGIKRPTAYIVLRSLEAKGFTSRIIKGKKTFFAPQHPKKLLTEAELRLKELKEVVPQWESLYRKEEGRPRVMIFEGKEELDRAYDESFIVKGEVVYIGTLPLSMEALPRTYRKMQYIQFTSEYRMRELINESEESREYARCCQGPYRQVRFIPKELLPFEADVSVFGDRTLITSVKKEYFAISIESPEIARAFRTIFEVMWQAAKE